MNIGTVITKSCKHFAGKTALVSGDKSYTYREVNQRVNRLANSLSGLSLQRGDRVALLMRNCAEYIETDFALAKAGLVRVALNFRLTASDHRYILEDSGASALIFEDYFSDMVFDLAPQLEAVKHYICIGEQNGPFIAYEELVNGGSAAEPQTMVLEEDLYTLMYTSGTSGKPKGVMHTHKSFLSMAENLLLERDVRRNDRMLHVAPLTHASGSWVLPHFARGAVNYTLSRFDLELLLQTIQDHRITTVMMVPTMILRLLSYPGIDSYDLSSLRSVIYGGSPMPLEKLKEAVQRFGSIFSQNFGQTEALTTITYLPGEYHRLDGGPEEIKKLSSAGYPYLKVAVKVVKEDGSEVIPGEPGEIILKSDHMMKGYWKNEHGTREKIVDGWLYTGDVATVDEEGFICIVDRKNDLIISGGFNIYPREIEEVLHMHPSVNQAAVVGVPDDEWVEAVKAFVVLKKNHSLSENELKLFCRRHLAGIKVPKSIEFLEQLPLSPYGKVLKRELKQIR